MYNVLIKKNNKSSYAFVTPVIIAECQKFIQLNRNKKECSYSIMNVG